MSCFTIPEWRYIALDKAQRNKLEKVNIKEFVKSWEKRKMPPGDRIWELKRAIKVQTFMQQKEDMRTTVLDIPLGVLCMHPPDEAANLLSAVNVGLDSLFANIEQSAKKFDNYLSRIHQTKPNYVLVKKDMGYDTFNYCSPEDYEKYGRVSSPKNFRGFLKSESEFAVIDQFLSIYMKGIARYFCGSVDVTSDNISHIEEIINDKGDLTIIKYEDKKGMAHHIDSILRADATVFTIGVGRDVVYDMSRAIGRNEGDKVSIIRSSNPEGTMMVLDGEARYKWTHSIPHSHEQNGIKYTIHLSLSSTSGLTYPIGKCKELDTDMHSASLRMNFEIPEWHEIILTTEQQNTKIDMPALLLRWTEHNYSSQQRVWDLKELIRFKTYIEQPYTTTHPVQDIPSNLVYLQTPPEAIKTLGVTKSALDFLFSHLLDINSEFRALLQKPKNNFIIDNKEDGFAIFNFNHTKEYEKNGRVSTPNELRQFLRSETQLKPIDDFWSKYMDIIVRNLAQSAQVTDSERARIESLIDHHGDLCIMRYSEGCGMPMHIDNLLRSDATVFTVGLGRDVVYDVMRVIGRENNDQLSIIRSCQPEGTMMVLDGEARYKWGHSIPYSHSRTNKSSHNNDHTKYTIILRIFHTSGLSHNIGRCGEIGADMYSISKPKQEQPQTESADHHSLLGLLMQLENTCIQTHIPERIKRPGLPRLHPRPGWL